MSASLHDLLPLTGMTVVPSSGFNPAGFPSNYRISGYHSRINGVELEIIYNVTHNMWSKRRRIEALHVGGTIVVGDCIFTSTTAYSKVNRYTNSGNYWNTTVMSYPIANYPAGSRIIGDIEWIDDRNLIVTVVVDGAIAVNRNLVTLPAYTSPTLYYRFQDDNWNRVAVFGGTVSNLSVNYEKELTQEYVEKTWQALSTPFIPYTSPMLTTISDNVMTSRILSSPPNSAAQQLDTLLVRGLSHRMFTVITAEPLGNGNSEIGLWLNTTDIEYGGGSEIVHDFIIGDMIYIDGIVQDGLNGCWRVERLGQTSIYFTVTRRRLRR
jgi:hypothetical protein